ncbi:Trk system potassium uptake protein TrkH [Hydrogenovibrio crunogenus]|uniref:Trk system potassium uptake protein n=1 Tax=Hydrogenovibrio crunogenus TaxID=39765 RepID=A0A4V1C8J8_9GAMM|nr:TrkH family potassium uptake protein [Hydrogenovibrio crunogenus]QBZ82154.1 Trk system potassium uptake protein TrkH [Hydrogenovibrio crunogenus]RUM90172.1 MAG: potassium transporter [Thiomicrospira sp.]
MHSKIILKVLGILLMVFSLTLIPPFIMALIYQDGGMSDFGLSAIGLFITGFLLWFPSRKSHHDLKIRDGFLIVVMFWTVLGFAGAVPMYFASTIYISLTDAIFESFSGLTTTGATVINGLDALPHSMLWYRQQLQWLGGMGIIVLAVAILPMLGIGGMQLYRAETPGPIKDNKLAPRISETAKALWYIYLGLTIACALGYWLAGMDWFDAFAHSFSTVAIGGFSTHDASIAHFDDVHIEIIAMIFMFLAAINFALHFTAFRNLSTRPYTLDPEFKVFSVLILVGIVISSFYLYYHEVYLTWQDAFRYGAFQTISFASTTGFANADFSLWPIFIPFMLIMMSFIGGSAGSTAGGMKVIRFILLAKQGSREIRRLLHPNALMPVKLNGKPIPDKIITSVWGFFSLYVVSFVGIMLLLMALGLDQTTAFSTVAATINNLGPALGQAAANYQSLSDPVKWVLTFTMLLGRLEIFTLLVLFTSSFWRK